MPLGMPPMNDRASGAAPLNSAPEKSKPGCCVPPRVLHVSCAPGLEPNRRHARALRRYGFDWHDR